MKRTTTAALAFSLTVSAPLAGAQGATAGTGYAPQLAELVNVYRERGKLAPLAPDPKLDALAREHSATMAKAGKLSHDGFEQRFERAGYKLCVENVGWNYPTATAVMTGWQNSSGHDRNLLDRRVSRMGIGMASGYVTFIACQ